MDECPGAGACPRPRPCDFCATGCAAVCTTVCVELGAFGDVDTEAGAGARAFRAWTAWWTERASAFGATGAVARCSALAAGAAPSLRGPMRIEATRSDVWSSGAARTPTESPPGNMNIETEIAAAAAIAAGATRVA